MLRLSKIKKVYIAGDTKVEALKGLSISFRKNEFVSILGPSGCGKTTLLNIVGGLDKYTSGDLFINGKSTKDFTDRDWDIYRNHRIGFIFQSYNLIPHQTVLENVELALTLSGIKKKERRERAIKVLKDVGLGDKLKSKPNQLSGGQMQRVAIARALVNDPEIILADEPTGALDSKTSVQIMELLKQVSKDRLVVMVTHNPELAEAYSSRIIRLLDGELIEDSKPYSSKQAAKEIAKNKLKQEAKDFKKTEKKKSMSFFTALGLSFKNLLTKKGRTIMVSLAGSIGIIGIALILAVSAGMSNYINKIQSESLSSYPVALSSVSVDMSKVSSVSNSTNVESEEDSIGVYDMIETLKEFGEYNYLSKNFVEFAKEHFNKEENKHYLNALNVSYASDMALITKMNYALPQGGGMEIYLPINNLYEFSAMSGTTSSTFFEELGSKDYVLSMYDLHGKYPTSSNEIALVLNSESIANTTLSSFGIEPPTKNEDGKYNSLKYSDLINNKTYRLILNNGYYNQTTFEPNLDFDYLEIEIQKDSKNLMLKQSEIATLYNTNSENYKDLTITAVLTLKEDAAGSIFSDGLMYTNALANEYRENCKNSEVVKYIKQKYATETSFNDAFIKNYTVRMSELDMLSSLMDSGLDSSAYSYSSPNEMKAKLKEYFNIELTNEEILDLYLQVYGASDTPTGIFFYVNSFEGKENVQSMIETWNNNENVYDIHYADSSAMLTNMLGGIVDIISIVLVAFASISLIVSSIMIGIITYTSVIERTKEIGVLRSVGASKKDVSRVFNAETTIIGFCAGLFGILISLLLIIPINLILNAFAGIANLASLGIIPAISLIIISVFLTFIAGLVPARIASKKDPVLALRSE